MRHESLAKSCSMSQTQLLFGREGLSDSGPGQNSGWSNQPPSSIISFAALHTKVDSLSACLRLTILEMSEILSGCG